MTQMMKAGLLLPVSAHISGKNLQDDTFYNPTVAEGDAFDGGMRKQRTSAARPKKQSCP